MTIYFLLFLGLLVAELAYLKLAGKFRISDLPTQRSSHQQETIRGGGIIYPIAFIVWWVISGFAYPLVAIGIVALALVCMADDISPVGIKLRLLVQVLAVLLLAWQFRHEPTHPGWLLVAVVMVLGGINAFNFMDGINGMTAFYTYVILLSLWLVNREVAWIDDRLLGILATANTVFAFFNARSKAVCFSGDVGSISLAYALLFLTAGLVFATGNPIFLLFFAVYGVDSALTILQRLYMRQNILRAHREHLYQYLANEKKWPHLAVSATYMVLQLIISLGVINTWQRPAAEQWLFATAVLLTLCVGYALVKYRIFRQIRNASLI